MDISLSECVLVCKNKVPLCKKIFQFVKNGDENANMKQYAKDNRRYRRDSRGHGCERVRRHAHNTPQQAWVNGDIKPRRQLISNERYLQRHQAQGRRRQVPLLISWTSQERREIKCSHQQHQQRRAH